MKRYVALMTAVALASCVPGGERLSNPPDAPAAPRMELAGEAVALTKDWISRALEGDFGGARRLTHGENGERVALDGLAESLFARTHLHGRPSVLVFHHATTEDGLVHVCAVFRFPELVMNGSLVSRQWPGQGLKVWEFRGGMEGCGGNLMVTTTLPPP